MTSRNFIGQLLLALTLPILAACLSDDERQSQSTCRTTSGQDAAWQADVECLHSLIDEHHPAPYSVVSRSAFREMAEVLRDEVPRLSTLEIVSRMMALTAIPNDVHTGLSIPAYLLPHAPVQFERFDDGVFALLAPAEHADVAGKELIAINGLALADVLHALAPLAPSETPEMNPYETTTLLSRPGLLWAHQLSSDEKRYSATFAGRSEAVLVDADDDGANVVQAPDAEMGALPISFTKRERNYWAALIPEQRLLYIQYNLCFQDIHYTNDRWANDVAELLASGEADRVLVDMRYNPGGYHTIIGSLKNVLARDAVAQNRDVYVAIGPATFSAALQNAIDLRDELGAVLIGNASTELANHTGGVIFLTLPNTGIQLRVASTQLENDPGNDGALQPDIELPRLGAEYVQGIDPVLEWFKVN